MYTNYPGKKRKIIHSDLSHKIRWVCVRVCVCSACVYAHTMILQIVVLNEVTTYSYFDLHFIVFWCFFFFFRRNPRCHQPSLFVKRLVKFIYFAMQNDIYDFERWRKKNRQHQLKCIIIIISSYAECDLCLNGFGRLSYLVAKLLTLYP